MAFWGNSDGAKHRGCIIIRATPHKKVLAKKYDRAWRSPKTVKIERLYVTLLDIHGTLAVNVVGCLEGKWDAILRTFTTLNKHKNNLYDHFRVIPWLRDRIINWLFGGILELFRWCEASGMHYKSRRTP